MDLIFPPKCPFCRKILYHAGICADCQESLPWLDERENLIKDPDGFSCAGALRYESAVREALLRLKFEGAIEIADPLGVILAQAAAEIFYSEFDIITWIPVSAERKAKRGYDQSKLLAESMCRVWGVKPVCLLKKIRNNPAQSALPGEKPELRESNVRGVYEIMPGAEITGKRVLLIDDIRTTGATLREARRVLMTNGAASVRAAVIALAGKKSGRKSGKASRPLEKPGKIFHAM